MIKKIFSLFLIFTLVALIAVSWRFFTKGFRPYKIQTILENGNFRKELSPKERKILKILEKKFKYLNKGSQSYVFVSEDQKYVIKFIAMNKYKEPFKRKLLSLLNIFKDYRENRIFNRNRNFNHAMKSYKIAFNDLEKETATLYFHNKKNLLFKKRIKIIDNLGISHEIDPNKTFFIVQKKAEKVKPLFLKFLKEKNFKKLEKILTDYLNLTISILNKGFINRDSSIKNAGYINGNFLELDLGRFFKIENLEDPKIFNSFLEEHVWPYRNFLKKEAPEMLTFFEKRLKKLKK
jgi:hypothetical protein